MHWSSDSSGCQQDYKGPKPSWNTPRHAKRVSLGDQVDAKTRSIYDHKRTRVCAEQKANDKTLDEGVVERKTGVPQCMLVL
ncbi:hypothetical protein EIP91_002682 [Steccherinum ochraceum]|uniref:Uncharacterized protein n=1 Tax=Steccherinum ochraceum TaxID=92696 RepID=A0A4R0RE88_9APHY|nr:hypothetical protein EIP91_002682 [Steccherinum ochraceum]